ncbi:MAG: allantoicase [Deltaproteobacteria bacterium]|nr:allantoicase [Deltaproteobacteria bacterium]
MTSQSGENLPAFTDLPDLACDNVGGYAVDCNDDFFASKDNLIRAHAAVWAEHEYGDRGKIMDGWETRRRRFDPAFGHPSHDGELSPDDLANPMAEAHDWCVVRLGLPGTIHGIVVDTAFFRGNYPDSCAIYAATIADPLDVRGLATATWTPILARSKLQGHHQNAFEITSGPGAPGPQRYTHVRLDIYPDGGVARLRVHGMPAPDWPRLRELGGPIDLAALEHGAVVESCSDMFFGSRNNLIKPGNPPNMSDGWETRRRRSPGNDWAIVRLAAPGTIDRVLIDTTHFRGNAPAQCTLEGIQALEKSPDTGWRTLLSTPLQPHTKHVFDLDLRRIGVVSHLKLSVFPCGGIARLRAWGNPEPADERALVALAAMSPADARAAFLKCCGSTAWATAMTSRRPFDDVPTLLRTAERVWWSLNMDAHREAFAAHPKIGAPKPPSQAVATAAWAGDEQKAASSIDQATADELARANAEYEAKHGFIFIVCATGRSADAMLADLRVRSPRSTTEELRTAAEEQIKITRLRLHKLMGELG